MIEAAKKLNCHGCIMQLPEGYDTVAGEAEVPRFPGENGSGLRLRGCC